MTLDKPYVSGHFTPVTDEITGHDLKVRGTLPSELNGRYFRNGHNPKPGITPTHWFRGEGMIHGIRLTDGRAEWYRNRWVRTPFLDGVPFTGTELDVSAAATNIIFHGAVTWPCRRPTCPTRSAPNSTPSACTTSAASSPAR